MPNHIVQKSSGVKRRHMPQIAQKDIADFVDYTQTISVPERRTYTHGGEVGGNTYNVGYMSDVGAREVKLPASKIKTVQKEINAKKVQSMLKDIENLKKRTFIISQEGYLLDGNHALAALKMHNSGCIVKAVRVDLPIKELIRAGLQFEKSTRSDVHGNKLEMTDELKQQFKMGMKAELEHLDTVKPLVKNKKQLIQTIARIVIDHLRERPDYYTQLSKMEKSE